MQIESQNYVLEDPQFGTSSQVSPTETVIVQTDKTMPEVDSNNTIAWEYLPFIIGAVVIAAIWITARRKPLL